eukprot:13985823-Alexandrium_andersonii.AAC.1
MSASLVGSEMCIRDRCEAGFLAVLSGSQELLTTADPPHTTLLKAVLSSVCLLYTSDAADDM